MEDRQLISYADIVGDAHQTEFVAPQVSAKAKTDQLSYTSSRYIQLV